LFGLCIVFEEEEEKEEEEEREEGEEGEKKKEKNTTLRKQRLFSSSLGRVGRRLSSRVDCSRIVDNRYQFISVQT